MEDDPVAEADEEAGVSSPEADEEGAVRRVLGMLVVWDAPEPESELVDSEAVVAAAVAEASVSAVLVVASAPAPESELAVAVVGDWVTVTSSEPESSAEVVGVESEAVDEAEAGSADTAPPTPAAAVGMG